MVQNKTYNNVVNTFLRIGEYHDQIFTTSVGDIWEIDMEKNTKFPLMHLTPINVSTGESELIYNFQVFIMDMVSEKEDWNKNNADASFSKLVKKLNNEQDVFNECLQISTDIIGMLRHSERQSLAGINDINDAIYFTDGDFTIEPFQERFDNLCCGWVFQINVVVQNDFQTCNIPVTQEGAGY
jgi:hypothetical protein|tara:strand:+ start:877 stop:1425 length:549 start_codon:yes stop_codon:yes gene_type:complete